MEEKLEQCGHKPKKGLEAPKAGNLEEARSNCSIE
jgi:hypothetical protein